MPNTVSATRRSGTRSSAGSRSSAGRGRGNSGHKAADQVARSDHLTVGIPIVGRVGLPPLAHLAWYVGVAALTVAEVVEWPVALVLAAGKALADNRSSSTLREFGEALDEAG